MILDVGCRPGKRARAVAADLIREGWKRCHWEGRLARCL
jgi:hypothetical protein